MEATNLITEVRQVYEAIKLHPMLDFRDRAIMYTNYLCFEDYVRELCRVINKMDELNKIKPDVVQINFKEGSGQT